MRQALDATYRHARRIAVAIVGGSVVLVGVAMLVLPGPAVVVIPAGLAILSLEFAWARRWLERAKQHAQTAIDAVKGPGSKPPA
jgi:tellurite resistance protein TerC